MYRLVGILLFSAGTAGICCARAFEVLDHSVFSGSNDYGRAPEPIGALDADAEFGFGIARLGYIDGATPRART